MGKKNLNLTTGVAFGLIMIGLIVIIYFTFHRSFNDGSGNLNPVLASNFGAFISGVVGPIFSLAGIILIYQTILLQKQSFEQNQFQNHYFALIRTFNDNVRAIQFTDSRGTIVEGKSVFERLMSEIEGTLGQVQEFFNDKDTEDEGIQKKLLLTAYYYSFYGDEQEELLQQELEKLWSDKEKVTELMSVVKIPGIRYGSLLASTYRPLYQTIKYVHQNDDISDDEKYQLVKAVRAQLSDSELSVLLMNCLTEKGKAWLENRFVDKYKLFNNLTTGFVSNYSPEDFFST